MNLQQIANMANANVGGRSEAYAVTWVKHRYMELASKGPLKPFRKLAEVNIPAVIAKGKATPEQGSKFVTADVDALPLWTQDIVGRYIRFVSNWYEIAATTNIGLELVSNYSEEILDSSPAPLTYTIAERRTSIEPNVRWVGAFINMRMGWEVRRMGLDSMDRAAPQRNFLGSTPYVYTEIGINENNQRVFEFYPYPEQEAMLRYTAYQTPDFDTLKPETVLPWVISPYLLVEGVMVDVFRKKASDATDSAMTQLWLNEARRQETRWRSMQAQFEKESSTEDDAGFILLTGTGSTRLNASDPDVMTGREQTFLNWTPLTVG